MRYLAPLLALLLVAPAQAGVTGWSNDPDCAEEPTTVVDVPCSISAWVLLDELSGTNTIAALVDKGNDVYMVSRANGTQFAAVTDNDAAGVVTALCDGKEVSTSLWRHVLVVFLSPTDRRVYVDGFGGSSVNSRPIDNVIDTLMLGAIDSTGTVGSALGTYGSILSRVAVWNTALTPQDAVALYNGKDPRAIARGYLQHYIPMRGFDGTVLPDVVTGVALTITGTLIAAEDGRLNRRHAGVGSDTTQGVLGSKLVVEYDGDSGASASGWTDSKGSYDLDNADGTPEVELGPNGRQGVKFASSSALYRTSSVPMTGYPISSFVVAKAGTTGLHFWALLNSSTADQNFFSLLTNSLTPRWSTFDGSGSNAADADDAIDQGNVAILEAHERDPATVDREIRFNASHYFTNNNNRTPTGIDTLSVGGRIDATPSYSNNATIYRVLILNAEPTDAERRRLYRVLDHLYGPMYDQEWPIGAFDP